MKRFLILAASLLLSFSLLACDETVDNDFDAVVVSEVLLDGTIDIHVVVEDSISSVDALAFIANDVAVATYNKHIDSINLDSMTLTIYLYTSTEAFNDDDNSYGFMVFDVNAPGKPGLSQAENQLTLGS
jgi:hypothetical protein